MRPTPCGEWAKSVAALKAARVARTNSVGHPVRRDRGGPLASYFIVQSTLNINLEKLAEQLEAVPASWMEAAAGAKIPGRQAVANVGCGGPKPKPYA
jgi:hypothetical protein